MARRRARPRARYARRDDYGGYDGWGFAPYVSAAARKAQAKRTLQALRKAGREVSPVEIGGRKIATTFWGGAWCDNLERYSDYANRLPRGRTYVRNGSVLDLQIAAGRVEALVSGSEIYEVVVEVSSVAATRWRAICGRCAGGIDSLVELLQGRFSKGVMEHLCAQETGLFPTPREIRFSCSCPDMASMCKHVAAVLYGVGARLDERPELLFRLREVNEQDLLASAGTATRLSTKAPARAKILADEDLAGVFGVELAEAPPAPAPAEARTPEGRSRAAKPPKAAARPKSLAVTPRVNGPAAGAEKHPKKTTKRSISPEARRAASERMRRYGEQRRGR